MDSKGHLLLVDDEEIYLDAIAQVLEFKGYEVDCGRSVAEARAHLERTRFDVLVSDIQMPGEPVLELIKQLPALNAGLPVILVTGHPTMDTALEALGNSVLAYLVKPVEIPELIAHLERGVRLRKVQALALESALRLQAWADQMKAIENDFRAAPASMGIMPLGGLVGMVLGNLASSTLELKQLMDLALQAEPGHGVCAIRDCPRLGMFQDALRDSVETLERTKGSFKSRELGDLRKRLSGLLEGAH